MKLLGRRKPIPTFILAGVIHMEDYLFIRLAFGQNEFTTVASFSFNFILKLKRLKFIFL